MRVLRRPAEAAAFLILAQIALAQTAPLGDIYSSQGSGQAESPETAYRVLYKLAAQITDDPSAGYETPKGDQTGWPAETAAQKQWDASMAANGNDLTKQQSAQLITGAAHLNAAIDDMERGYRIEINPSNDPNKEQTVQKLYAAGRKEFAQAHSSAVADGGNGNNAGAPSSPLTPEDVDANRMLQLAAQMGAIARQTGTAVDHFTLGLADWAKGTLTFLAQKPGVPVSQASQAIVKYLTSNSNENHAKLQAMAEKAVQAYQKDPARFLGQNLPNLLPLPKIKALQQIAGIEKGTQEIAAVAKAEQEFAKDMASTSVASEEKFAKSIGSGGPPSEAFSQNTCFKTALAQDHLWAAGESFKINGVYNLGTKDLLINRFSAWRVLKTKFPNAGSSSSLFTESQAFRLDRGVPIDATMDEIKQFLQRPGSRGLVVAGTPYMEFDHMFNARNNGGIFETLDAPNRNDGSWLYTAPEVRLTFFPTN